MSKHVQTGDAAGTGLTGTYPSLSVDFTADNIHQLINSTIVTVTTTGTIASSTFMQRVNSAATTNQTLPTATLGKQLIVKNINSGVVTLVGTVDGAVNPTLASQYKFMWLMGNGTNWDTVGGN